MSTEPTEGSSAGEPSRSVLRRGLSILDAFRDEDTELSLAELALRTGIPKPTVHRFAAELASWGALERCGSAYRLGFRLFVLGARAPRHKSLRELALPFMEDLYEFAHENVHLAILDGISLLYLAKVTGHRSSEIVSRVGNTLPAYCTAAGKVLLAFSPPTVVREVVQAGLKPRTTRTIVAPARLMNELSGIHQRGYGVNNEETVVGIVSIAAPVFCQAQRIVAALSVTGRSTRLSIPRVVPALQSAANGLSRHLAQHSTDDFVG